MKKNISFKMWLTVFFGGIWQFIRNIFSWRNKTPFWRVIWATITVCILAFTSILGYAFYDKFYVEPRRYSEYYDCQISPKYKFHNNGRYYATSYIYDTETKKKVMKGLDWIAIPESGDSLMVVSKGGKRGYINRYTLEIVIPFKYDAAWSFCEDAAAVCEGDSIYFIDHKGTPINNVRFKCNKDYDNYAYHGKYAAIPVGKKYGLIDKAGTWIYPPNYDKIRISSRNLWCVMHNNKMGVIGTDGAMLIPCDYKDIEITNNGGITVTLADNSQQLYDYNGDLLEGFVYLNSYHLAYYTDEIDNDGNQKQGVADLLKYSTQWGCGLMTKMGVPVTKPIYSDIECMRPGVYECEIDGKNIKILVNSKGQKINE